MEIQTSSKGCARRLWLPLVLVLDIILGLVKGDGGTSLGLGLDIGVHSTLTGLSKASMIVHGN